MLGDAVNLASRVEGLTKYYGVKIITTDATMQDQTRFVFRQLDLVRVKGKKMGIAIYEVICRRKDLLPALNTEIELSNQALQYYFKKEWEKAQDLFISLNKEHPEVKLYSLYLKRIDEFKTNPPPENWDGVYIHTSK